MAKAWMPLYVADYLADTMHLSATESGAYLHLIMHYWQTGSLPVDDAGLARIARVHPRHWPRVRGVIAPFFGTPSKGSLWTQKRVSLELSKNKELSNKRKGAAEQMLRKRRASAEQLLTQSQSQSQKEEIVGLGRARAREDETVDPGKLADRLAAICGFPDPQGWPPGWCGATNWVRKCLADGWEAEIMVDATMALVKQKRDGPIEHYVYLEKPLARAMARHRAPLPKVQIIDGETIHESRSAKSLTDAASRMQQSGFQLGPKPSGLRADAGEDPVRLLSEKRGE